MNPVLIFPFLLSLEDTDPVPSQPVPLLEPMMTRRGKEDTVGTVTLESQEDARSPQPQRTPWGTE